MLERLGFAASRSGDLVVAKRKLLPRPEALAVLRQLGALSAFTRQMDLALVSDQEAERLTREFLELARADRTPEAAA